jgi:hypothetical protein
MWFLQQFDSLIHLGTCKEYPIMAKAKSPKTTSIRSKNSINKNDKPNGAPTNGLDVPVAVEPATQAEKIAADMSAQTPQKPEAAAAPAPLPGVVAKKSNLEPLPTAAKDLDSAIRQRAYQIYLERHGAPGNPQEDWARAEREVREAFDHQKSA